MSPMVKTPLTIEHALLGFLHQQPMHGYEIHRRLTDFDKLGRVWWLPQNKLYALLNRLEREGYVSIQVEPQPSRPARKVYSLTPAGREAYHNWLHRPVKHGRKMRLEFLLKLYFMQHHSPAEALSLVEQQRHTCQNWLNEAQTETAGDAAQYQWLVQKFRIGQMEAMLNWLDLCRDTLQPAPKTA